MTRALFIAAACSALACVSVQDLGSDRRAPEPLPVEPGTIARPLPPVVTAYEPAEPTSCPSGMPAEGTACSNVAWCAYPLEGASGLSAKCGCSLGRWVCLRVRDERRQHPVAVEELPLTLAACTEGAACEEGTKCSFALLSCECTSSGRLRCVGKLK